MTGGGAMPPEGGGETRPVAHIARGLGETCCGCRDARVVALPGETAPLGFRLCEDCVREADRVS